MMAQNLRTVAQRMKAAQDEARQIEPLTSELSDFEVASAYEVAHLIHEQRMSEGASPLGRKIGFTNYDLWPVYGVREPIWGYVYDTTVEYVSSIATATCDISRFTEPKIEPEIVFHFRTAPPADSDPAAILDCIDWIANGFEIVQSHFPGWKFTAADTIADSALHGCLLVGEPRARHQLGADLTAVLKRFSINLFCNGKVRDTGHGANVLGSPLAAVAHLIQVIVQRLPGDPLRAGEIVTTGTLTAAHAVSPGETWHTELDGIDVSGLRVNLVA